MKLTQEEFINKCKLIHDKKYDYLLVEYINSKTRVKIYCKNCNDYFFQTPAKHLHLKRGCHRCGGSKKLTVDEFIKKSNEIHKNKYDYSLVEYINSQTKVKIICPVHGVFEQLPNNHISKKYGCSKCSNNKKFNINDFIEKTKIHGNKYDYSLVEYKNAHTKVKIICPVHGVFEQTPNSHIQNIGCPKCKRSKGEEKIESFLKYNNIVYVSQKTFEGCKYINKLKFDFYLSEYNCCIEFDGKQHFELSGSFWGGFKSLIETKKKDNIKTQYCENNNIKLYRIKYNENINDKLNFIYNDIKNIKL